MKEADPAVCSSAQAPGAMSRSLAERSDIRAKKSGRSMGIGTACVGEVLRGGGGKRIL
jgi:hypothetical protein